MKLIRMFIILLSLLLLASCGQPSELLTLAGKSLYVSPTGDNANPGTLQEPLRTIQKAMDLATPGTIVYLRAGTYRERTDINVSGSAGQYITLRNYPNEKPVIDGNTIELGRSQGLITISNQSYIKLIGLTLKNARGVLPFMIQVNGASSFIEVRGNTITGIYTKEEWAQGITFNNDRPDAVMRNVLIVGNKLSDMPNTLGEAMSLSGNVENAQFIGNQLSNLDTAIGIDILGNYDGIDDPVIGVPRNVRVANNDVRDGGICLYVDGGSGVIMENNFVLNCGYGIQIASEIDDTPAKDNIVRSNLVLNSEFYGLVFGAWIPKYGDTINCLFANNTVIGGGEAVIRANPSSNCRLINNIAVAKGNEPLFIGDNASNLQRSNNIYYSSTSPVFIWNGATYSSFNSYKTATGQEGKSLYANPRFVGGDNFRLQAGSPAINAGTNSVVSSSTADLQGSPRVIGGTVDIGTYEFQP